MPLSPRQEPQPEAEDSTQTASSPSLAVPLAVARALGLDRTCMPSPSQPHDESSMNIRVAAGPGPARWVHLKPNHCGASFWSQLWSGVAEGRGDGATGAGQRPARTAPVTTVTRPIPVAASGTPSNSTHRPLDQKPPPSSRRPRVEGGLPAACWAKPKSIMMLPWLMVLAALGTDLAWGTALVPVCAPGLYQNGSLCAICPAGTPYSPANATQW
jgi:hypothetical protein